MLHFFEGDDTRTNKRTDDARSFDSFVTIRILYFLQFFSTSIFVLPRVQAKLL